MSKTTHKLKFITICIITIVLCTVSFITVSARRTDLSFIENSGLTIKEDLYFMGLPEKSQAIEVMDRLADPGDVYLKNNTGVICEDDDIVGTGYDLSVIQFGVVNKTVEAVIIGDINGDGKVLTADYIRIKKAFNGTLGLEGAFFLAADVNHDGRLTTIDYMRIKSYFNKKYDLYQELPEITPVSPSATANPNPLGDSVEYANQVKNQVKNYYETSERKALVIQNNTMKLVQGTLGTSAKNVHEFTNKDGGVYFTNSFEPYLQDSSGKISYLRDGKDIYEKSTPIIRNGYYFYETHFRDIDFNLFGIMRMDLTYNTLPDSLRVNHRLIVDTTPSSVRTYTLGNELKIDKKTVNKLEIADKNGTHNTTTGVDSSSVEYVAFDIKDAGVVGLIFATDCLCDSVTVTLENGMYVIRSSMQITEVTAGSEYNMTLRLYNDATHNFTGIQEASYLERNPVALTVDSTANVNAVNNVWYDSTTGMYKITANVTNLWTLSAENTNKYSEFNITASNDSYERPVYIHVNTSAGGLATGVIRNGDGAVVAIPTEICKNFSGDDPTYEADVAYGDIIFPLYLGANESVTCIPTCLWQNWGSYPLQQISSIQYYFMYLHMSQNVSETTCLTPLGGGAKDGKIVADFRGCSGDIWESQPQYNHAGNFYFTSESNIRMGSELVDMNILCSGPTYGKMDLSYVADSGKYEYKITHMEFPSVDETRNYYTLEIKFLKDMLCDTRAGLQLLSYNTTMGTYSNMAYLDNNGVAQESAVIPGTCTLNKNGSYFTFYTNTSSDTENVGIIVKNHAVTVNGEEWDGALAVKVNSNFSVSLILTGRQIAFKKGDTITVNFILLPYGNPSQTHYDNVLNVYNDCVVNALTTSVSKGTLVEDPFMPMIYAEDNAAEFTISGGANNVAVRVDGFHKDSTPLIYEYLNGQWVLYDNSVKGYDGYYTHYNEDNSYGYSFVVDMGTDGAARKFKIEV